MTKLMEAITKSYNKYKSSEVFQVTHIEGDNAFECIKTKLQGEPFKTQLTTCH